MKIHLVDPCMEERKSNCERGLELNQRHKKFDKILNTLFCTQMLLHKAYEYQHMIFSVCCSIVYNILSRFPSLT